MAKHIIYFTILLTASVCIAFAGTKGKIAGIAIDAKTKEPIIGVNVVIVNSSLGASTDVNGYYCILNIPPGSYDVRASCLGYTQIVQKQVSVSIDRTTTLDFSLTQSTVSLAAVEVVAQRDIIVRDLTSTEEKISAEDIANLPVESIGEILQLQAGVTRDASGNLHMRGGRESEVQYYIDGMPASNPFNGQNAFENMQNDNVQEMQVISGTFNAEYGDAMSGIVNIVTKRGGDKTELSISAYGGDFVTNKKDAFQNIDNLNVLSQKYVEGALSGPMPFLEDKLNYRISGRYRNEEGWLYGRRDYLPSDTTNLSATNPSAWKIQRTGDGSYVPMNPSLAYSIMAKLNYAPVDQISLMYSFMGDKAEWKNYSHSHKLTPDYVRTNYATSINNLLSLTHSISSSAFHELKFTYETFSNQAHVRDNPFDPLYEVGIQRTRASVGNVFAIGGVDPNFLDRKSVTTAIKYELTSQLDKHHLIKVGSEYRAYDIEEERYQVRRDAASNWRLIIDPVTSTTHNYYHKKPIQAFAYLQDKIEVEDFIMNIGARFDYFNARSKVPQNMSDPHNDDVISHPKLDESAAYKDASAKMQISPRLGLAFPISENGNIHASYGYFFQIPELQRLYENPEFEIIQGSFLSFLGNADLEAQRTVIYELGLQQRLAERLVLDVTCFYKDYRNLLGSTLYRTFDQSEYGQYTNRDYGYVWGFTIAFDILKTGLFSANVDYTYQVAEGNGSDPVQAYINAGRGDESAKSLIPLNWDQRNVLNAVLTIDGETWGIRSISHYATGTPYDPVTTFDPQRNIQLMNQGRRRAEFNMDIRLYKHIQLDWMKTTFFVSVENVFDAERIDLRPQIASVDLATHKPLDFLNSLYDYRFNPGSQPRPRLVKIGVQVAI
jgi:outer membrane receptor protein involved in Fe transport